MPNLLQVPKPTPNPLQQGNLTLQSSNKPFVIAGLKAAQPGGLGSNQTNTLKQNQLAKPADQKATGTTPPLVNPNQGLQTKQDPNAPVGSTVQPSPLPPTPSTPPAPTAQSSLATVAGFAHGDPELRQLKARMDALDSDFAAKTADIYNTPSDLNYQTGRIAAIQSEYNSEKAALNANYQSLLQARGQDIGAATTALGATTQLQASPYGTPQVIPATGTVISGGQPLGQGGGTGPAGALGLTGNYAQDTQSLAQQVKELKIPYQTAVQGLQGFYGQTAGGNLNSAIAALGGDVTKLQAQGQAIQSNVQTTGTAGVQAANTAYNTAVQKVAANTATYSALTGVSHNLNETLANWSQTGQLTNVNAAINSIAGLTSNPQYQQFITALGNAQASYQAALGSSGVTPTKADQDALAALNPNSSASAINAALNQLSADAHALLIVPAYQQQQTYAQQLGIQ